MKKILFFSILLVSSIILVASCGSADPKEKCSCDYYARGDKGLPVYSSTKVYEAAENFYTTCASLQVHMGDYLKSNYPLEFDHLECKKVD